MNKKHTVYFVLLCTTKVIFPLNDTQFLNETSNNYDYMYEDDSIILDNDDRNTIYEKTEPKTLKQVSTFTTEKTINTESIENITTKNNKSKNNMQTFVTDTIEASKPKILIDTTITDELKNKKDVLVKKNSFVEATESYTDNINYTSRIGNSVGIDNGDYGILKNILSNITTLNTNTKLPDFAEMSDKQMIRLLGIEIMKSFPELVLILFGFLAFLFVNVVGIVWSILSCKCTRGHFIWSHSPINGNRVAVA